MQARLTRRSTLPSALVGCIVVALASAAGSTSAIKASPPSSPLKGIVASLNGLSLPAREAKLLDLSKKEGGTLELYTSLSSLIIKNVVKGFETKYSGITVNLYRAGSETLAQRIISETSAGVPGADVIETNGTEMFFFQRKKNVLVPYRQSPYAKQVPEKYRFDTFTAARLEAFVAAWNTNLVPSGQQPKSFTDLANPRWAGKLSMEPGDIDWFAGMYTYLEKKQLAALKKPTTEAGRKKQLARVRNNLDIVFARMAKNSQITSGHTTQATLLAAGQFSVVVSAHAQSVEQLKAKKAPVTFGAPFVNPVLIRPQGMGISYRLRHPATAMLFYDWMLSAEGQQVLKDNGSEPSRIGFDDPELNGSQKVQMDLRALLTSYGAWAKKYDGILQNAKK